MSGDIGIGTASVTGSISISGSNTTSPISSMTCTYTCIPINNIMTCTYTCIPINNIMTCTYTCIQQLLSVVTASVPLILSSGTTSVPLILPQP